jgi:hypothetical protein
MAIQTQKYIRKPLYVDAVRITSDNFDEIVSWCQGEMQQDENTGKKFIKVRVQYPMNPRQTQAFVGDWLLYTDRGYKVYTTKAFAAAFDKVEEGSNGSNGSNGTSGTTVSEFELNPGTPENIAQIVRENEAASATAEKADVAEGKRVLSLDEQRHMSVDAIRDEVRSGEAVLEQDIPQS